jgi:hypothetical protein
LIGSSSSFTGAVSDISFSCSNYTLISFTLTGYINSWCYGASFISGLAYERSDYSKACFSGSGCGISESLREPFWGAKLPTGA